MLRPAKPVIQSLKNIIVQVVPMILGLSFEDQVLENGTTSRDSNKMVCPALSQNCYWIANFEVWALPLVI
jgi:hypothetical protein